MYISPKLLGALGAVALASPLAVPAAASAKAGDLTAQQTFPRASTLCTNIVAGKPKRLVADTAQLEADCAALQSSFQTARTEVLAVRAATAEAIAADRSAIDLACPKPKEGTETCRHTTTAQKLAIKALRRHQRTEIERYYVGIEAARKHFWAAVKALPHAHNLRPDARIEVQSS